MSRDNPQSGRPIIVNSFLGLTLSDLNYRRSIIATYSTFGIVIIIIAVFQLTITMDSGKAELMANLSGVLAGLALAITSIIRKGKERDSLIRGLLLLGIIFALTTLFSFGTVLVIEGPETLTITIVAGIAISGTALITPHLRRIRNFEFYTTFLLVPIMIPFGLTLATIALTIFLLASINLLSLLCFIFLNASSASGRNSLQSEIKVRTLIQQILETNKARALTSGEILQQLAGHGTYLSLEDLENTLEAMNRERNLDMPMLAKVGNDYSPTYVPRWNKNYAEALDRIIGEMRIISMDTNIPNTSIYNDKTDLAENDVNFPKLYESLSTRSGFSIELIREYFDKRGFLASYEFYLGSEYDRSDAFLAAKRYIASLKSQLSTAFQSSPKEILIAYSQLRGVERKIGIKLISNSEVDEIMSYGGISSILRGVTSCLSTTPMGYDAIIVHVMKTLDIGVEMRREAELIVSSVLTLLKGEEYVEFVNPRGFVLLKNPFPA